MRPTIKAMWAVRQIGARTWDRSKLYPSKPQAQQACPTADWRPVKVILQETRKPRAVAKNVGSCEMPTDSGHPCRGCAGPLPCVLCGRRYCGAHSGRKVVYEKGQAFGLPSRCAPCDWKVFNDGRQT